MKKLEPLDKWEIVNPNCIIIKQDEAETEQNGIAMPSSYVRKAQSAIGTAVVLKKADDSMLEGDDIDAKLGLIEVGSRVKFSAGTQISAEFEDNERVQILHVQNILMVQK